MGSDHTSGLRTVVGNRIDDRLALGLARGFISRIERGADAAAARRDPYIRVNSVRERRDALLRIRDSCGPLLVGMMSQKGCREALMATYRPFSAGGGPVDTLAIRLDWLDLAPPGSRGPAHKRAWPIHTSEVRAVIRIHAIARYIQRTGRREPEELLPVLKRAAAWSGIARTFDVPGSWFLPVENGLICATGGIWTQGPDDPGTRVPFIRTFIARDNFRPRTAEVWDRLAGAGALELRPSLLGENTDPALYDLWGKMWKEGRAWDERRAEARRLRAARAPERTGAEPVYPDEDPDPDPA